MTTHSDPLLAVENLTVRFRAKDRPDITATDDMQLTVNAGECVVVLGESGSGKSVTARAVMGLLEPTAVIASGSIRLQGRELLGSNGGFDSVRGTRIAMVFQDSLSALNPVQRVGAQIAEMFVVHRRMRRNEAMRRAIDLMGQVAIPDPHRRARAYPHELSGGMRQRIVIAMALALEPEVLIADEPTTALDVTVQADILELLRRRAVELGMGLLFITHDVGVAADIADRVVVMYAGSMLETGSVRDVLERPAHPYTRALLDSVPRLDGDAQRRPIRGSLPDPRALPAGCLFQPRCPLAVADCQVRRPALAHVGHQHSAACLLLESSVDEHQEAADVAS